MEAGRTYLGQTPPPPFPARSRLKPPGVSSVPATASTWRHFPASVLSQEQRDELRPPLSSILKEGRNPQNLQFVTSDQLEVAVSVEEGGDVRDRGRLVPDFEQSCLSSWTDFWTLNLNMLLGDDMSSSSKMESVAIRTTEHEDVEPSDAVDLAKRALTASKVAASIPESASVDDDFESTRLGSSTSSSSLLDEVKAVRSTKRLQRESVRRRVTKQIDSSSFSGSNNAPRKTSEVSHPNDPLRYFLWGPETKQLLTVKEESELIDELLEFMRLEEKKKRLELKLSRQPTLAEWAEAVGLSCDILRHRLHCGKRSRERLINANLRMVVHIAKQYQGRGLSLHDLLQEGTMGLMKSIEKFKPQAGCRFASYAYWWVRQTIRKAIHRHSRTIRLPENIYALLAKVIDAKRSYIQEGNYTPTNEEIARRVGITVNALDKLLFTTRLPLSLEQRVWSDQDTTFQEIIADTKIETPEISVAKQLMRQQVRQLLNVLPPKERLVIRLRYGIDGGKRKTLSEIGNVLGISKERVRQVQNRAMEKLRQCHTIHELKSYADLLV